MSEFTILVDSREQKPFTFEGYSVETEEATLETGDYAVKGKYGESGFAVERKAKSDFLNSITHERDRFEREIERADGWNAPLPVVVEAPWLEFTQGNYYRDINPNSIIGTVEKWPNYYNVDFFFSDSREEAESKTFDFLKWWFNRGKSW